MALISAMLDAVAAFRHLEECIIAVTIESLSVYARNEF
jgi:hypothetical protein